jgi:hypothetical protein
VYAIVAIVSFRKSLMPLSGDFDMVGVRYRYTLRDYDKNNGHGWGVIAKRMGIKPGSSEFQALKGRVSNSNGKYKAKGKYKSMQGDGMYRYGDEKPGNSDHDNGKKNGKGKDKKE